MDVKWIKLSTDMLVSSKITRLRTEKNGDRMLLIWVLLLLVAGKCNKGGRLMLTEDIPSDLKTISRELGFSEKLLELAFEQFVRLNMIVVEDGVYSIKNWEKYQSIDRLEELREYNRLAKQKSRAKKSRVSMTCQSCQDIEEEEELEKEKEIEYSFNQSCKCDVDFEENVEKSVENQRQYLRGTLGQGVVFLSNEQFDDLMDRLSLDEFEKYVGIVRDQELAGKHYKRKTHYQAILDMARQDRRLA